MQCVTPIITRRGAFEDQPTASGETVQAFRDAIAAVVSARMASDENLYLVDGLTCVGSEEGLEDDVHPNNLGMQWFAKRVAEAWGGVA